MVSPIPREFWSRYAHDPLFGIFSRQAYRKGKAVVHSEWAFETVV